MVAASAAPLMHPLSEAVGNSVDGDVREEVVPCGGTGSTIVARRAGGVRSLAASRALFTGCLRQAAEMIYISYVQVGR
ncbi:hypothetical protein [Streptomyces xanthophaeus]